LLTATATEGTAQHKSFGQEIRKERLPAGLFKRRQTVAAWKLLDIFVMLFVAPNSCTHSYVFS
jgi:hypothetical protein